MWTVRLFWVIYSLDRRWSFGTGMPFAMQDADIDPQLPEPVRRPNGPWLNTILKHIQDDGVPYLKAMVRYGRICSKVRTRTRSWLHHLANAHLGMG